ncbi:aldo/keto reductase [uncultured Draconibacterium sp.]|uniref:aldo/keto reductase n=1 Tax=uncultured Draconibacterium sp. TaxID=1573823 RepID=UPI0025D08C81|nr:aldo/keto reductase [uncultured Draconibacterium sp.]
MIEGITDCTILNNGLKMPWLGFGVFQISDGNEVINSVKEALKVGYRSIDTAAVYGNETGVGKAIRESGIAREDIFLTTKVWNSEQCKGRTLQAFDESLGRLQTDYVDLYLVHWPVEGYYMETWKAMEEIYKSGRAKSIGVSNFMDYHLDELLPKCEVVPAVNQIEYHPYLVMPELYNYCNERDIRVEAWSPLMQGHIIDVEPIRELAAKYKKTPAQITLRWNIQKGVITIPKSVKPHRILENSQIYDFEISLKDMTLIDTLDRAKRFGPDPNNFNF